MALLFGIVDREKFAWALGARPVWIPGLVSCERGCDVGFGGSVCFEAQVLKSLTFSTLGLMAWGKLS